MKFTSEQLETLLDILRWRRDVRHFYSEPIAPDALAAIEASVDLAPSVGNSRPWRIVRVNTPECRTAVIRAFQEANREASRIYQGEERRDYLALKLAGLAEAPVHLAFFTDMEAAEGRGLGRQTMPETLLYSTVMAIHTLWLTARALNIGVGWVSIIDPAAVSKALSVPESWRLTGYLCLGHPRDMSDTPELHRAGWQADTASIWIDR
jgi:5,6-dimethylbenzimidazole synthase